MPRPLWTHYCAKWHFIVWQGRAQCDRCGVWSEYHGWHLNMWDQRGAYARRTGLKPTGKHRLLADMLLGPMFVPCPDCAARGLVADASRQWRLCRRCYGNMCLCCVAEEEFTATRQRILKVYPEAEFTPPRPPGTYPFIEPLLGVPQHY